MMSARCVVFVAPKPPRSSICLIFFHSLRAALSRACMHSKNGTLLSIYIARNNNNNITIAYAPIYPNTPISVNQERRAQLVCGLR